MAGKVCIMKMRVSVQVRQLFGNVSLLLFLFLVKKTDPCIFCLLGKSSLQKVKLEQGLIGIL